jgi:hypothetical protein
LPDGQRGEVISVVQRRRRWTTEQKLALVEEAMRPGSSVAGVADRHGVSRETPTSRAISRTPLPCLANTRISNVCSPPKHPGPRQHDEAP